MAEIVVVGSLNEDLIVHASRWPEAGETVFGERLDRSPGGKGANQAAAAARLGGEVMMVGRVGDDAAGHRLREGLRSRGVDVANVATVSGTPTGTAVVGLAQGGAVRTMRPRLSGQGRIPSAAGDGLATAERLPKVTMGDSYSGMPQFHRRSPAISKNPLRNAGSFVYVPRNAVVRVFGLSSRTPRICVHR